MNNPEASLSAKAAPSRRAERIKAFQILYALFFSSIDSRRGLMRFFAAYPEQTPDTPPLPVQEEATAKTRSRKKSAPQPEIPAEPPMPSGFAWNLVEGVWRKQAELDNIIQSLSENWRIDRIGRVELTILRLCVYELAGNTDTPHRVVINEGIELSREFGDDNSHVFVNGVLDAAIKAAEAGRLG